MIRPSRLPPGRDASRLDIGLLQVNISKSQQRTLHALAQGGRIDLVREDNGDITGAECWTRDGWLLSDCNLGVFKALKKRRFIASKNGGPYRITRDGLLNLRSRLDNRVTVKAW
jgi:uncharacterized protein YjhX (UPF0386 family)